MKLNGSEEARENRTLKNEEQRFTNGGGVRAGAKEAGGYGDLSHGREH